MKDCFGTDIEVGDELLSWQNLRKGFLSPNATIVEIDGDVAILQWIHSGGSFRINQISIQNSYWQKSESPEDVWDKFNKFAFNEVIHNAIIQNELSKVCHIHSDNNMLKHYLRIRMNYLCKDLCISF